MSQLEFYTMIARYCLIFLGVIGVLGLTIGASLILYIFYPYVGPRKED